MISKRLEEIINSDDLGLLHSNHKADRKVSKSDNQRIIDGFYEIVSFYEEHNRLPNESDDFNELKLHSRLQAIKKDPNKVALLLPLDMYDILDNQNSKSFDIVDLIDDPLRLLNVDVDDSIFTLKHVREVSRIRPDFVSHRKICQNFDDYLPIFNSIKDDLKYGKRKLVQYKDGDLIAGFFYVLGGVLLFLEKTDTKDTLYDYKSGNRVREDGRTRCIFDNGTESNMLFRSLEKSMHLNGFCISNVISPNVLITDGSNIEEADKENGYIYVLSSLSNNPSIKKIKNLYKIGYCTTTISERISNAKNDPTYLMAEVKVVLSVKCFNLNVYDFENAIHKFFGHSNINFKIMGKDGIYHYSKEWFSAPLNVIEEAIPLIVNGNSGDYFYDPTSQLIIKR